MNLQIISDNTPVTDRMKEYITEKLTTRLDKFLSKYEEDTKHATLRVSKIEKTNTYILKFAMNLPGKEVFAKAERKADFKAAVTDIRDKVLSQIKDK